MSEAHYFVRALPERFGVSFGVCYETRGGDVVSVEVGCPVTAERIANRMNVERAMQEQDRHRAAELRRVASVLGRPARAGVRYFEPDQFA